MKASIAKGCTMQGTPVYKTSSLNLHGLFVTQWTDQSKVLATKNPTN